MRLTPISRMVSVARAAIAALLVLAVTAPVTSAHNASFDSEHSLSTTANAGGDVFSGQLHSNLAGCRSARSVTLYHRVADASLPDQAIGTTSTDSLGAWSRTVAGAQAGEYYAVAADTVLRTPGHKHTCLSARTNTVALPPDEDRDGVRNGSDNCPSTPNARQQDSDEDGLGNACDPDADGDGYTAALGDCADDDASRHPAAPETSQNGIDDDCDGSVDEDVSATLDADGDGDGYAASEGDCDDIHPQVNPGGPETDDGIDNDCDGAIDEGFDTDGDGYTPRSGDCDDNDAQIHPGWDDPENDVDDNCDRIVDGTVPPHMCWVPASLPIAATVRWSQVETMDPCNWTFDTFSNYWGGTAFMISSAWWAEYTPSFDGAPVAFRYWDLDWTFVAMGASP